MWILWEKEQPVLLAARRCVVLDDDDASFPALEIIKSLEQYEVLFSGRLQINYVKFRRVGFDYLSKWNLTMLMTNSENILH